MAEPLAREKTQATNTAVDLSGIRLVERQARSVASILGVGFARQKHGYSLALVGRDAVIVTNWNATQEPALGVDPQTLQNVPVGYTARETELEPPVEDERVRPLLYSRLAHSLSRVEALAAWASRFCGTQRQRLLIANRRYPSACALVEDGGVLYADTIPAGGTVFEFFCRTAARCGWPDSEERLQWLSLSAPPAEIPEAINRKPDDVNPLLLDVNTAFDACVGLEPPQRASIAQQLLERRVALLLQRWAEEDASATIVLMGDFAYNPLLVRALERSGVSVKVPFAAGEHSLALGAALAVSGPQIGRFDDPFIGPEFTDQEIKDVIDNCRLRATYLSRADVITTAAAEIASDRIVGWFQGKAELGPRTLGARSILASPKMSFLSENLNVYVKNREAFRPFALSIPEEHIPELAECSENCLWMASLARPSQPLAEHAPELVLPNGEMRVHVVRRRNNPVFHQLMLAIGKRLGLPAVVNTSFNSPGQPVVSTPRDAIRTFFSHGIDTLFIGRWMISK